MSPSSSSASDLPPVDFQIVSAVLDLHDYCPQCGGEGTSRWVDLLPHPPHRNMDDFRNFTLVELLNENFVQYNKGIRIGKRDRTRENIIVFQKGFL